ncbi:MAG: hypothetical protein BAJALOKI3v1_50114 [Promethearchaeota archaeon]|nr:MAG: hypothetical protein BAJALOKI3v1_50114 [Candidatus Lokiarchaeota archaeon]
MAIVNTNPNSVYNAGKRAIVFSPHPSGAAQVNISDGPERSVINYTGEDIYIPTESGVNMVRSITS